MHRVWCSVDDVLRWLRYGMMTAAWICTNSFSSTSSVSFHFAGKTSRGRIVSGEVLSVDVWGWLDSLSSFFFVFFVVFFR